MTIKVMRESVNKRKKVQYVLRLLEIKGRKFFHPQKMCHITKKGLPSGFDIMYLALADTNMVVRFGLKVVWES